MIRRYLKHGEALPRFYGFAWYDHPRRCEVIYPIPLNWIVWALRAIHWRLAFPPEAKIDKLYQEAMQRGHTNGFNTGFKAGHEQGFAKGLKDCHDDIAMLNTIFQTKVDESGVL